MSRVRRRIRYYGPGIVALLAAAFLLLAGPLIVTRLGQAAERKRVQLARTELADSELLAELNHSMQNIARAVEPSVVHITVANKNYRYNLSTGSGWIYDAAGHIVTNHHVVGAKDGSIEVQFYDGARAAAVLVGSDEATDVAVIRVAGYAGTPARRAAEAPIAQGDLIFAFGSPFGFQFSMSSGIVSGQGRFDRLSSGQGSYQSYIQTDAAINPGNSGGPLTNLRGEVIGMNFSMAVDPADRRSASRGQYVNSGVGLAIPIEIVEYVADQLIATGTVARGGLGIELYDLDLAWQNRLDYHGNGVRVGRVIPRTPAEVAGLHQNDVIISVDGKTVNNMESFRALAHAKSPGEQVVLGIWRSPELLEIAVILNKWDDVRSTVRTTADSLLQQAVEFRGLGLVALALDGERLVRLGFDSTIHSGLYIQAIRLAAAGTDLGFRAGTVIIAADGQPISTPDELAELLRTEAVIKSGATLEVVDIHNEHRLIKLLVPQTVRKAPVHSEDAAGDQ